MNRLLVLILIAVAPPSIGAHEGPRIWIGNDGGTVRTYSSDDDFDPSSYATSGVFSATLSSYFGVHTTEFPGYEVRRDGGNMPADTLFGFKLAGPTLMFEPAQNRLRPTDQIFSTTPAPRFAISLGGTSRITTSGVQDGFDFFNFASVGDHSHLSFTLLGNGMSATSLSPDGVYVLPMLLTSPSLDRSSWYHIVLDKNGQLAQIAQARSLAQLMIDALPGDTNFDGSVDFDDLLTLAQNYGATQGKWWATGDFDFNGAVDFDDLLSLAQRYGSGSGAVFAEDWALAQATVPEPVSVLSLAVFAAMTRRHRTQKATSRFKRTIRPDEMSIP